LQGASAAPGAPAFVFCRDMPRTPHFRGDTAVNESAALSHKHRQACAAAWAAAKHANNEATNAAGNGAGLPRLLHQTWKTCSLTEAHQRWWERCANFLPETWKMHLWTDASSRRFIEQHFPGFLPTYDSYDVGIKRSDAARYFWLLRLGGVYMDLDFTCLRAGGLEGSPVTRAWLRGDFGSAVFVLQQPRASKEAVSNAFMASAPGHPFLEYVVSQLNASSKLPHPLDATGPRFLTRRLHEWRAKVHEHSRRRPSHGMVGNRSRVGADAGAGLPVPPMPALLERDQSGVLFKRIRNPCGVGRPQELARCAAREHNVSVTTFWSGSWVSQPINWSAARHE